MLRASFVASVVLVGVAGSVSALVVPPTSDTVELVLPTVVMGVLMEPEGLLAAMVLWEAEVTV